MTRFICGMIILCGLGSCGLSEEEVVRIATQEYERKARLLRQQEADICKKAALEIAEIKADSIVRSLQLNPLKDTLYRPPVPPKPAFIETDSARVNSKQTVKPILDPTGIRR